MVEENFQQYKGFLAALPCPYKVGSIVGNLDKTIKANEYVIGMLIDNNKVLKQFRNEINAANQNK